MHHHYEVLTDKCRYIELSDSEREKLEGSQKVLKKLERLQGKNER